MVIGRLKGAVSDMAETLRRLFADPACHRLETGLGGVAARGAEPLEAGALAAELFGSPVLVPGELRFGAACGPEALAVPVTVQGEPAFAQWAAGAQVWEMEVFRRASGKRSEVPPLPRRAQVRGAAPAGFRGHCRGAFDALARPRAFQADPVLERPRVCRDLGLALGLPMAIGGDEPGQLPKAQWMRYTLQIVKATGENIRNLDVLGIYRIPAKGVASLRHDARTGRLVIQLSPDASGAARLPFMLARRKDDRSIVSCYLEGG